MNYARCVWQATLEVSIGRAEVVTCIPLPTRRTIPPWARGRPTTNGARSAPGSSGNDRSVAGQARRPSPRSRRAGAASTSRTTTRSSRAAGSRACPSSRRSSGSTASGRRPARRTRSPWRRSRPASRSCAMPSRGLRRRFASCARATTCSVARPARRCSQPEQIQRQMHQRDPLLLLGIWVDERRQLVRAGDRRRHEGTPCYPPPPPRTLLRWRTGGGRALTRW